MTTQSASLTLCQNHSSLPARFQCGRCGGLFCQHCVQIKEVAGTKIVVCPKCKDLCHPLAPPQTQTTPTSFLTQLADAFVYPVRGHGKFLIIGYIAIILLLNFSMILPGINLLAFIGRRILGAYVIAFLFSVITSSAAGDDQLPDWPDLSNWLDDILHPAILLAGTILFCFGLPIGYHFYYDLFAPKIDHPMYPIWIMAGVGAFYLPMALLAVAMHDNLLAANPFIVLPAIFRIFPAYLALLVMMAVVVGIAFITAPIPGARYFLGIYFPLVFMRLMGLIYHTNHKKLAWFE